MKKNMETSDFFKSHCIKRIDKEACLWESTTSAKIWMIKKKKRKKKVAIENYEEDFQAKRMVSLEVLR